MAPSPENDKEPKAPDKSVSNHTVDLNSVSHDGPSEIHNNIDMKLSNVSPSTDAEDNKDVDTLDDGQLKALLDEAYTYKRPKDREGKSSLFKELLEEVEQDEQACEAAVAAAGGVRHSNSLQELVAALAAEPAAAAAARRRDRLRAHHHAPAAASSVSARAIHGGSLPSGVDTSFLLGEEPPRLTPTVGGYVATVRCVNPPPLGERRVSTSDAHPQFAQEQPESSNANRRSCMAAFPMTYTARASLEIGAAAAAAAGPGRAVTSTTASHQVRTPRLLSSHTRGCPSTDHYRPSAPSALTALSDPSAEHLPTPPPPPPDQAALANAAIKKKKKKKSVQTLENSQPHRVNKNDQNNSAKDSLNKKTESLVQQDNIKIMKGAKDRNRKDKSTASNKVPAAADILLQSLQKPLTEGGDIKNSSDVDVTNVSSSVNRARKSKAKGEQTKPNPITDCKKRPKKAGGPAQQWPSQLSEEEPIMWYSQTKVSYSSIAYGSQSSSEDHILRNYQTFVDTPSPGGVTSGSPNHIFQKHRPMSKYQIQANKLNEDPFYKNYQTNSAYKKSYPLVSNRNNDEDNDFKIASKHSLNNNNLSDDVSASAPRGHSPFTLENTKSDEYYPRMINTRNLKLFSLSALNPENVRPTSIGAPPPPQPHADTDCENKTVKTVCGNKPLGYYSSYRGGDDKYATMVESGGNTSPIMSSDSEQTNSDQAEVRNECISALDDDKDGTGDNLIDNTTHSNHSDCETQFADDVEREITSLTYQKFLENVPKKIDCDIKNEISTKLCSNNSNMCSSNKIKCDIELTNIDSDRPHASKADSGEYFIKQAQLLNALKTSEQNSVDSDDFEQEMGQTNAMSTSSENQNLTDNMECERTSTPKNLDSEHELSQTLSNEINNKEEMANAKPSVAQEGCEFELIDARTELQTVTDANREKVFENVGGGQYIVAELANNTYVFLTLPKRLLLSDNAHPDGNRSLVLQSENNTYQANLQTDTVDDVDNNNLRMLRLENVSKSGMNAAKPSNITNKVDSGIPFSCITTPEVVTSCHTTSSMPHSSIAVDAKPRGLSSVAASSARPSVSALAALDDYKKSIDENGNSLQGITSSIISSSQHKKPRRKKTTSRNETVIKSHQIDGYQGNKDIDEVLRFIESNAEHGRGNKLQRPKQKDDADDKGKKRSTERRAKDKEQRKRANSMEELSRTNIEDLTDKVEGEPQRRSKDVATVAPAAERRSWGDDNRDNYYFDKASPPPAPIAPQHNKIEKKKVKPSKSVEATGPGSTHLEQMTDVAAELLDFQTVTKKKKQRKRVEERAPRVASPERRRKSAPPSDKSNDSNDDLDSVHSLPGDSMPAPHAPRAAVSYADIARTRHNIPDLIESCNYYPEVEAPPPPAPPYDADSYPALAARSHKLAAAAAAVTVTCVEVGDSPASPEAAPPDVVAARRPAVILAVEGGTAPGTGTPAGDMDGVTFGFDVNEQLLVEVVGSHCEVAESRCDLVRSAGVVVLDGGLRYVPPPPASPSPDLLHYVAHAWEDIVKCSGSKVRYFSE